MRNSATNPLINSIFLKLTAKGSFVPAMRALQANADVNARYPDGTTALHHAAAKGDIRAINFLLNQGADTEAQNLKGQTALQYAEDHHQFAAVKLLSEERVENAKKHLRTTLPSAAKGFLAREEARAELNAQSGRGL